MRNFVKTGTNTKIFVIVESKCTLVNPIPFRKNARNQRGLIPSDTAQGRRSLWMRKYNVEVPCRAASGVSRLNHEGQFICFFP